MSMAAAVHCLRTVRQVIITSHRNPDGDGIGAALALRMALRAQGTRARVILPDPPPTMLDFLPGADAIEVIDDAAAAARLRKTDALISVDCGDYQRLGAMTAVRRDVLLNIDHHASNDAFGDIALVDLACASTTMVIEQLLARLGHPLDAAIAGCLYTGLVFDTGRFMHANTDASVFRCAARLLETGVDAAAINRALTYCLSPADLKARRIGIERLRVDRQEPRIAGIALGREDMRRAGRVEDWGELVELPRSLAGIEVAYLMREQRPSEVRCSLRSNPPFAVGPVAAAFGGGGHAQAAGCTIEASLPAAKRRLVAALRAVM